MKYINIPFAGMSVLEKADKLDKLGIDPFEKRFELVNGRNENGVKGTWIQDVMDKKTGRVLSNLKAASTFHVGGKCTWRQYTFTFETKQVVHGGAGVFRGEAKFHWSDLDWLTLDAVIKYVAGTQDKGLETFK